ncbi:MAG: protease complex subunit PrcB family protein [Gemmatimonadaceae bacterium]
MRRRRSPNITLLLLAAASTAGCNTAVTSLEADRVPADAAEVSGQRVLLGSLSSFRYYSGLTERQRLVIRSSSAWDEAWKRITARSSPAQPAPAVDFDHEIVVLVAMGQRPTGGYSIAIEGLFEAGGALYALVRETSPGSRCFTTQALTQPIDAVRVPRRAGAVAFVERTATNECD